MHASATTRRTLRPTERWRASAITKRWSLWTLALVLLSLVWAEHPLQGSFTGTTEAGPVVLQLYDGAWPGFPSGFLRVGDDVRVSLSAWAPGPDGSLTGSFSDEELSGGFQVSRDGDVVTLLLWDPDGVIAAPEAPEAVFTLTFAPDVPRELARGRHATLLEPDALAFVEALEYVLALLGLPEAFTPEEREDVLEYLPDGFVSQPRLEQLALADAGAIWAAVQANWATSSEQDRRTFALGLVTLAYGEASVQAWLGVDGRAGRAGPLDGSASCDSVEACLLAFVDTRTWRASAAAQGCWAIAGCRGYDHARGAFEYGARD